MDASYLLSTPHSSVVILDASDQDTGTNLHTQDRSKVLNAPVRHVLIGAICHVLLFGTTLHTQESRSCWRHLSASPVLSCSLWRHILSHGELVLVRM